MLPSGADAGGLRGSKSSMELQHEVAIDDSLTFLRNAQQVAAVVGDGGLEFVEGNENYALSGVSFPYARPEVKLFISRISAQFRESTGGKLVVTSLTRPSSLQPRNAHMLSVHPAGMAVDFRVPGDAAQRQWLEKALLGMESSGVLDVTRERYPPHYHIAVFPKAYLAYVETRGNYPTDAAPAAPRPDTRAAVAEHFTAPSAPVSPQARTDRTTVPLVLATMLLIVSAALLSARRMTQARTPAATE